MSPHPVILSAITLTIACTPRPPPPCREGHIRNELGDCTPAADSTSDSGGGDASGAAEDRDTALREVPEDTTSAADTGGATSAPLEDVVRFEYGGTVTCPEPWDRAAGPPFYAPDLGEDWAHQNGTQEYENGQGGGVTVADLTGDGLLDIYLPQVWFDQLYVGQADGTFADETAARMPPIGNATSMATAVDIDGDRDLDLYVSRLEGPDYLLLNDGSGHFTDKAAAAGFGSSERISLASSWSDMDGDGDLDVFVATYRNCNYEGEEDRETSPGTLWENRGDGTFLDVSDQLPEGPMENAIMRTGTWFDYDRDGDRDFILFTDAQGQSECLSGNVLFLNKGGAFTEAPPGSGVDLRMASMGTGVGDLNGDLLPDFLLSDLKNVMLLESLGPLSWYDTSLTRGLDAQNEGTGRSSGWGTELADLDNDGDLDGVMLYGGLVTQGKTDPYDRGEPDAIYIQGDDGTFTDMAAAWGLDDRRVSRGLAVVDLDGDGFLDLIRRELDGDATVHLSRCDDSAWLDVRLEAPPPNTYAIDAEVRVVAGEQTWVRWLFAGGTSLYTSVQPRAHFGLGDLDAIDRLEVTWPDGLVSVAEGVTTRQRVLVRRSLE